MTTLEDAIRQAIASSDGLKHLTLAPSGDQWQAAYKANARLQQDEHGRTIKSESGYRIGIHEDPISAIIAALTGAGAPASVPSAEPAALDPDIDDLIG